MTALYDEMVRPANTPHLSDHHVQFVAHFGLLKTAPLAQTDLFHSDFRVLGALHTPCPLLLPHHPY